MISFLTLFFCDDILYDIDLMTTTELGFSLEQAFGDRAGQPVKWLTMLIDGYE